MFKYVVSLARGKGIRFAFSRDNQANVDCGLRHLLIMNGWSSHDPEHCLVTDENILPFFWGSTLVIGIIHGNIFFPTNVWPILKDSSLLDVGICLRLINWPRSELIPFIAGV